MPTLNADIDALADRAKQLPEERQRVIVDALRELLDEPYVLSAEELAILRPALAAVLSGSDLCDADHDDILNTPWS